MPSRLSPAIPLLALVLAPAAHAAQAPAARDAAGQPVSWIAELRAATLARAAPRPTAAPVALLDPRQDWTRRSAYRVTGWRMRDDGTPAWVRVQLPVRPNGAQGWLPGRYVRLSATRLHLEADLSQRRLDVMRGTRLVRRLRAGIGRPGHPTPTGTFAVQARVATAGRVRHTYGPRILALTAFPVPMVYLDGGPAQVAIHGTGDPSRVGRATSLGCLVVRNADVRWLARVAVPGVPVTVRA